MKIKTDVKGTVRDVTQPPYNAKGDGMKLDTKAIQKAVDDCAANDIVLIPEGKTFLTGALDLKSDMTLEVNGTLLSSKDAKDFEKRREDFEFSKPVIDAENNTAGIEVKNNTSENQTAVLIVAGYENGIMKGVSVSDEANIATDSETTLTADAPMTGDYKIMVWDSLSGMKPLYTEGSETEDTSYSGGTAEGLVYTKEAPERLIWSRIEGWEQYSYRSLINVGSLDENTDYATDENYVCSNVKICGTGTITGDSYRGNYPPINGNATALAIDEGKSADEFYDIDDSETTENNIRSRIRGRLINVSNAQNVYIKGVTVANPPCWTVHMIYSDNITTNGVSFKTSGYRNGDGWDPDSSTNCTIFDCDFSTGDDCIAIKSGKNPEGNEVGRPSENIKVLGCRSDGGLGLAVGSEMSGGVEGVYVRDCVLSNTRYGIELKANKVRGGYIKNFNVQDSTVDQILVHSVTYNADGEPADTSPVFSDMSFKNMNIIGYYGYDHSWLDTAIQLVGFTVNDGSDEYYVRNVSFEDIVLGTENNITQNVSMQYCRDISFDNVKQSDGNMPLYAAKDTTFTVDGGNLSDIVPEFMDSIEAERMNLDNFAGETNSVASGGAVVKLNGTSVGTTAEAKAKYTGESGTKDICVTYFDENDGVDTYTLYVNEAQIDTWDADENFGSDGADEKSYTNHITHDIDINNGDTIKIVVTVKRQYGAGRFDKLEVGAPGTFHEIEKEQLAEGISGSVDAESKTYTWTIGQAETASEAGIKYSDKNDYADLTVSLGAGDSMYGGISFNQASVREPDTLGQTNLNDTKRYLLIQPKLNGTLSITAAFPEAASNKKERVYYADLGENADVENIDLTQYFKASHETAGADITSSAAATRTIDMEEGHAYILYTYQHACTVSAISYTYKE